MSFSFYAQDSSEKSIEKQHITKELNWISSFAKAKEIAKKKKKPILVFFTGSDWCGPCKMLQEDFFHTDEFMKLADNSLVLYEADFPRRTDIITPQQKSQNFKLQGKFGVRGYPTIIFLDSKGNEIGRHNRLQFYARPRTSFYFVKRGS